MRRQKKIFDMIRMAASVLILLTLFYRSVLWVTVLAVPLCLAAYCRLKMQWREEERWQLDLEFKEGLQGISAALNAGYSIENALEESQKDLLVLYGEGSLMCRELQIMTEQLRLNQPVESVFDDLAERSGVEDIRSFAEVFRTAKRSGGDLVAIARTSAEKIGERIEVSREIRTMIAGKRMEGKIMNMVPLGMILYFWLCSPGFFDCFYEGLWGRLVMTCFLAVYLTAYLMSERICQITV